MTDTPAVAVHLVVHNGAPWLRKVLDSLMAQTWPNLRVLLLDATSDDSTADIVKREYPSVRYIHTPANDGIWAGQEHLLTLDDAPFVLVLTDVQLDPAFIKQGVRALMARPDAGAAQAKIYRAVVHQDGTWEKTRIIDTVGFRISRSFRITNLGHGEVDHGQYDGLDEVFGTEGAAPLFRRSALEACRIDGALIDPDYRVNGIGYGDDVDLSWRMRLFGFRHVLVPGMLAWHPRSTTTSLARSWRDNLRRISARRAIPISKRRLDWSNIRFTIIKNAFAVDLVRNLPWLVAREVAVAGYTLLVEPGVFREAVRFLRLAHRMLHRRCRVMRRAVITPSRMRPWFFL